MDTFIARQPIFDRQQRVYAYELLCRSSLDTMFNAPDPNSATAKVISDSLFLHGSKSLTGEKKAFIQATQEVLIKEYITLLPKESSVVEILETVEPDPQVIEACKKLKQAGYLLALEAFVYEERYAPLVEMADIIKVDVLETLEEEQEALVRRFAPRGIRLLAENVETREAFYKAWKLGYTYFQGYFFSKPVVFTGKEVPGFKLHYLQILREINRPELDFGKIEAIIKQEMSLAYKLLCYINSAAFGWTSKVNSLKRALVLLGEREVKKWISLIALASMGEDKPEELVVHALLRAKFCESLAPKAGLATWAQDLFLVGMLSLIDAILDRPLADILHAMPLPDEIIAALLGEENLVWQIYACALAYERGNWGEFSERAAHLRLDEAEASRLYLEAAKWSQQIFHSGILTS